MRRTDRSDSFQSSVFSLQSSRRSRAFTLVELLVVMVVIVILVGAVLVAGSSLSNKAKSTNTQAMLTIVDQALQEFAREQRGNPTLASKKQYQTRYGYFPPDEMEVFVSGIPCDATNLPPKPRTPGGAKLWYGGAASPYPTMVFDAMSYRLDRNAFRGPSTGGDDALEFRDQIAMITAIELYGDASASLLNSIQERYRATVIDPAKDGEPALFVDRDNNGQWDADKDQQLRILIDDWGTPITYMSQRDWSHEKKENGTDCPSTNHEAWNEASSEFIRINSGRPILASYGPDGPNQLTREQMGSEGLASLIGDFEAETGDGAHRVDNPVNADNVYVDPTLKEKLARGIVE
jgi:prepilin-type N-terminal cleavage/methylation domain-containing protein